MLPGQRAGRVAQGEIGSGERTAILSSGNPRMPTSLTRVRVPTNGASLWNVTPMTGVMVSWPWRVRQ
ncbi:hypothetical protein I551_3536 [Mycobacterium ulcerans str. Harvey]|uniref:Uncharacterized protein n=1 Tax=Mycobacterium ulcerans str. Harvey TaxID=1299332 RepID=A0ABN0QYX2_MYCUL|nr:hypothetical protein I551_3536 [Mycobacterium ulcerans str. Harvey]